MNRAKRNTTQVEAQKKLDRVDSELNELYRQVRDKEAQREEYDRIANPDDYSGLDISIGDYS
jgi:hypothetical protein